jgi:hypothetical protein
MSQCRQFAIHAAIAGAVASASLIALPSTSVAADPAPLAVSGTVAGNSSLEAGDVFVLVEPTQEIQASTAVNEMFTYYRLPSQSVTLTGHSYRVAIDPDDLPASTVSDFGLVNFEILAQSPDSPTFGVAWASARAVADGDGAAAWAGPLAPDGSPTGGVVVDVRPSIPGVLCAGLSCSTGFSPAAKLPVDGGAASSLSAKPVGTRSAESLAGSCPAGGAGNVKAGVETGPATVGASYPIAGDTSWMTFANGSSAVFETELGVADNSVGFMEQTGRQSLDRSFGFDWDKKGTQRTYSVEVEYQLIKHYFDRCPPEKPYFKSWKPIRFTGGLGAHPGQPHPDYSHCVTIASAGTWWRQLDNGHSYSLSAGVKVPGIGISLSSTRAYNQEARLAYRLARKARLCGSDDVPPRAGKLEEESYLGPVP